MLKQIQTARLDKKGVSIMIGYVLLVSLAIVMGIVMYNWMKSYVPNEDIECPDGVALQIIEYNYSCNTKTLNVTLRNSGRFNVAGFTPRVSKTTGDLASNPIYDSLVNTGNLSKYPPFSAILITKDSTYDLQNNNTFSTGEEKQFLFNLNEVGSVDKLEIIPVRWQTIEEKLRFVSCSGKSSTSDELICN